tara:strand:+ start:1226 stop:1630 length:405 start_codon:yes stop_codon:yes gene_type:complete
VQIQSAKLDEVGGYTVVTTKGKTLFIPNEPLNKEYRKVQEWIVQGNTPTPSDEDTMTLANYKERAETLEKQKGKQMFIDYVNELDTSEADAATYKSSMKAYLISNVKDPINAAINRAEVDAAKAAVDWGSVITP